MTRRVGASLCYIETNDQFQVMLSIFIILFYGNICSIAFNVGLWTQVCGTLLARKQEVRQNITWDEASIRHLILSF